MQKGGRSLRMERERESWEWGEFARIWTYIGDSYFLILSRFVFSSNIIRGVFAIPWSKTSWRAASECRFQDESVGQLSPRIDIYRTVTNGQYYNVGGTTMHASHTSI